MYCPNCGNQLKNNQKFCNKCGAKISLNDELENNHGTDISNKTPLIFSTSFIIGLFVIAIAILVIHHYNYTDLSIGDNSSQEQVESTTSNEKEDVAAKVPETPADKLYLIDEYQAKYFRIIRRNDFLLKFESDPDCERDREELQQLFQEVKNRITNTYYLNKYNEIEERFSHNPGETTVDMNIFASQNYDAVDELLNEVYQAVKKKIPADDFKNLINSEVKWLKDVEGYKKIYDSQGFGTIGTLVYFDYEINMRNFRTLLLMLYL